MGLAWIPNALTVLRCVLAVVIAASLIRQSLSASSLDHTGEFRVVALLAFIIAAGTDFLDGWLARRFQAQSAFGAWLDPIADKWMVALALLSLSLVHMSVLCLIPTLIIVSRDIAITRMRMRLGGGYALPVMPIAKWKTAAEMLAIGLLIAAPLTMTAFGGGFDVSIPTFWIGLILLWCAAGMSAMTGWQYWRQSQA